MGSEQLKSYFAWAKQADAGPWDTHEIGFVLKVPGREHVYLGSVDYSRTPNRAGVPMIVLAETLSGAGMNMWFDVDSHFNFGATHTQSVSVSIEVWPAAQIRLRMVDDANEATLRTVKLVDLAYTETSATELRIAGSAQMGGTRDHVIVLSKRIVDKRPPR